MRLIVEACTRWKWLKKLRMHQVDTYFWAVSVKGDLFYQKARGIKIIPLTIDYETAIKIIFEVATENANDPDNLEWQFA